MKNKLLKIISAVVASSMLLGSVCYAKDAYMIADAPERVLASWKLPSDATDLVNGLNGVDSQGNAVEQNKDMGNGWSLKSSTGTWSVSNGYLTCKKANSWETNAIMMSNEEFSDLNEPFVLDVLYLIYSGFEVFIGKSTAFGDSENDYYCLKSTYVDDSAGNNHITLQRVKGSTTQTSGTFKQWGKTDASLTFDGSKLSFSSTTAETIGTNEWCELEISEPVTSGRVYLRASRTYFQLNNISLTKPAGSAKVKNFYVNLSNFTAADVSKENLAEAGWTLSGASGSVDGQIRTGHNGKLRYDDGTFGGDYTITTKVYIKYNGMYARFAYKDANNYYALVANWLPVDKVYNTETQSVDTVTPSKYLTVGRAYLIKVSAGVAYILGNKSVSWNGASKVITINMSENDDGSETISVTSPVTLTYTDVSGDADGEPFTEGKFYYTGEYEGSSRIDYVKIYPTYGAAETTFDFYVDGVKAQTNTLSKGLTALSMPIKYAGTRNKIIVALYENHEMTDHKVYTASDFYFNDKLELFDTSACGDDATISVMMWNSLDEVKPIVKNIPIKTVQ